MTAVVIVVLSLVTKPIPKEELCGLTWATIGDKKQGKVVEPQFNEAIDECKYSSRRYHIQAIWRVKIKIRDLGKLIFMDIL